MMTMNDCWKVILSFFGGLSVFEIVKALLLPFVSYWGKILEKWLSTKMEEKAEKEMERYKSIVDSKQYISKARFDREFEMYRDLSEAHMTMVYDMGAAVIISRGGKHPEYNTVDEFIQMAAKHHENAEMMNKRYAPFISKEIFEMYKELGNNAYKIISRLDLWEMFNAQGQTTIKYNSEMYTQERARIEIEAQQKELSKLSDEILDNLRDYLSKLDSLEE